MTRYLLNRVTSLLPVLMVVSIVAFMVMHLTPGDPAAAMLGLSATPEEIQALRQQLGLDQPLLVQFFQWAGHALRGNFGNSIFFRQPVLQVFAQHLEPTLLLAAVAELIAVGVGIPAGVIAAVHRGRVADQGFMTFTLLAVSIPEFWLALNLILFFSVRLGWLPVAGYSFLHENPAETFKYLIMPAVSLGLMQSAFIARMTRSGMIEVLSQDYIRTALAKGVRQTTVVYRHALRNALVPVVTVLGIQLTRLLGGAVVVESVFGFPGMGRLILRGIGTRDYPVVQAVMLAFVGTSLLVNLATDMTYGFLDPRVRVAGSKGER